MRWLASQEQELFGILFETFWSLKEHDKVHESAPVDVVISFNYQVSDGLAKSDWVLVIDTYLDDVVQ